MNDSVQQTGNWRSSSTPEENTLTVQELQAAYLATYDLGPGYPQLEVPPYVRSLYMDDGIEDLSLRFAPFWSPEKQAQVDADLDLALRHFLKVPGSVQAIRPTFSGSIALDRVLAAAERLGEAEGFHRISVVTTTPSIDIMRLFLEERRVVAPIFVPSQLRGAPGPVDVDAVCDAIARGGTKGTLLVVLLTSPENPTGEVWSAEALGRVAEACAQVGGVIVMDHCFAVAGVHDSEVVPRIWDIGDLGCDWAAVWDTGKTFGLNEDKLGFIVCGSQAWQDAVDGALAVTQFGVARRQKMFFAELFRRAFFYDHVGDLRSICRVNALAASKIAGEEFAFVRPRAGSLLLLDVSVTGHTDEGAREQLLAQGIGVVAGNVFFHTNDWRPTRYLRIALARRPDYFAEAMHRLVEVLT